MRMYMKKNKKTKYFMSVLIVVLALVGFGRCTDILSIDSITGTTPPPLRITLR
jgi:hypothetical protein